MAATAETIEAVVIEGHRLVRCNDCGATLAQFRLEVLKPLRCAGVKLWSTPTHEHDGKRCPAKSVVDAKGAA